MNGQGSARRKEDISKVREGMDRLYGKSKLELAVGEEETFRVENRVVSEFEHRAEMTRTALSTVVTGDS